MAEETDLVAQFIATTLAADTSLVSEIGSGNIYDTLAPQPVILTKYVTFHLQTSASDLMIVGARRVWASGVWLVKMVGKGKQFGELTAGADRIDALLHRGSGNVTGGKIIYSVREQSIRYVENDAGIVWRHLGGLYRIIAQST